MVVPLPGCCPVLKLTLLSSSSDSDQPHSPLPVNYSFRPAAFIIYPSAKGEKLKSLGGRPLKAKGSKVLASVPGERQRVTPACLMNGSSGEGHLVNGWFEAKEATDEKLMAPGDCLFLGYRLVALC